MDSMMDEVEMRYCDGIIVVQYGEGWEIMIMINISIIMGNSVVTVGIGVPLPPN